MIACAAHVKHGRKKNRRLAPPVLSRSGGPPELLMPTLPTHFDLFCKEAVIVDPGSARVHEVAGLDVGGADVRALLLDDGVRVDLHGHAAVALALNGDLRRSGGGDLAVGGHR